MKPYERRVNLIAVTVCLTGFLYALDIGSIGPITQMSQFSSSISALSSTMQGFYVACILLSASVSSLASGHIADRISRKYTIIGGGLVTMAGTIISAACSNLGALFGARIITGAGIGTAMSVATVYLVEISPPAVRGSLAGLLQLFITIGVAVGYFIAFGSRNLQNSLAWRIPFICQSAAALILCIGGFFIPFSPRWLVQTERSEDAQKILARLREPAVAERELREIEESIAQGAQECAGFTEMFDRRYLRRTLLGVFMMICLQMNGIDAIQYFAPIFFVQAGFTSERASFLASGVSGLIMIGFTIPAWIWMDKWSRRMPLVIGGVAMGLCFIVIGSLYAHLGGFVNGAPLLRQKDAQWIVIILIYLFVASCALSWGVICRVYTSEIIPTRLRAKVCAVEQVANWIVNFIILFTTPIFLRSSLSGAYFLYGLTTLVAAFICYFVPETKGRSLEEIETLFEKERGHMPEEHSR